MNGKETDEHGRGRQALEDMNQELGQFLKKAFPSGVGFALLVFSEGPHGWMTWCSNAERQDMIKALEELLERFRAGTEATVGDA